MRRLTVAAVLVGISLALVGSPPATAAESESRQTWGPGTSATVFGFAAPTLDAVPRIERRLGHSTGMVSVFADFTEPFPTDAAALAADRGVPLLIAWEPWDSDTPTTQQPTYRLRRISAGRYDGYLREWLTSAQAVVAAGTPVLVRWAPEMNGDWRPWSTHVNGNRPGDYVAAWRHVWRTAHRTGAVDVTWVWNPIVDYQRVPMRSLYPGARYVDVVALDGYNWGAEGLGWQSFDAIFAESVAELRRIAPGKPWGIAEIGCAPGPLKHRWVLNALRRAHAEGAAFVAWFEFVKETDWRMSASPRTALALSRLLDDTSSWTTGTRR